MGAASAEDSTPSFSHGKCGSHVTTDSIIDRKVSDLILERAYVAGWAILSAPFRNVRGYGSVVIAEILDVGQLP